MTFTCSRKRFRVRFRVIGDVSDLLLLLLLLASPTFPMFSLYTRCPSHPTTLSLLHKLISANINFPRRFTTANLMMLASSRNALWCTPVKLKRQQFAGERLKSGRSWPNGHHDEEKDHHPTTVLQLRIAVYPVNRHAGCRDWLFLSIYSSLLTSPSIALPALLRLLHFLPSLACTFQIDSSILLSLS